jgi:hypothetical protein
MMNIHKTPHNKHDRFLKPVMFNFNNFARFYMPTRGFATLIGLVSLFRQSNPDTVVGGQVYNLGLLNEGDFLMKRLALILLIPLILLACRSDEKIEATLISYSSPNYPVTFMMPEEWAISDDADSITIATREDLLFAATVVEGARINMIITPSFFVGSTNATEIIDTAVRTFREQEGVEIIQEIQPIVISSQQATETVLRGSDSQGNEVILRYLLIENPTINQTAVVAAVHDASQNNVYGQLMADIVASIQLVDASSKQ